MHTEGKLTISPDLRWIIGADGNRVASTGGALTRSLEQNEANARRLVACWNACDGLPQDALDGGWTASGLSKFAHGLEISLERMAKERDELVSVLRSYRGSEWGSKANVDAILAKYPQS